MRREMHLLQGVMQGTIVALADGDVRPIADRLHAVHLAKEATEAALDQGEYTPPRNADRLPQLRELDEAFHAELERMVAATAANDLVGTAGALGRVMSACHTCHQIFR